MKNQSPDKKVELLAPAGNMEKLEIVLHYGADAVYLSGKAFSLRNFSGNFSLQEIEAAKNLARSYGAKIYVAVNIFARAEDLEPLEGYLSKLNAIQPDGIIIADPGVLAMAQRLAPSLSIHMSTQANTTNREAMRFWRSQGVRRVNAARELSLQEIEQLSHVSEMQVEAFVHGAMCISYSGRCLLSNYMAGRPSNQGMCCQPCRFQYAVVEQTRPGQYFTISEDERGTYIFNSRDLCMLEHLPQMLAANISALKIEGRMKGIHYAATAVNVYRAAIDRFYDDPENFIVLPHWQAELQKITSRGYNTGFYLNPAQEVRANLDPPKPPSYTLAGKVLAPAGKNRAHIEVRNKLCAGDPIEIIQPGAAPVTDKLLHIIDDKGRPAKVAQPGSRVTIQISTDCRRFDILRRKADHLLTRPREADPPG